MPAGRSTRVATGPASVWTVSARDPSDPGDRGELARRYDPTKPLAPEPEHPAIRARLLAGDLVTARSMAWQFDYRVERAQPPRGDRTSTPLVS
jgi:hypothetical protein